MLRHPESNPHFRGFHFFCKSVSIKILLTVSSAILFGCATEKPLVMNDLSSLGSLKVIRFDTPEIELHTMGGMAKSLLWPTSWMGYGLLSGVGVQAVAREEGRALKQRCMLSDYGQLVMNKFTGKVVKEIPNWPRMLIEENPVEKTDYEYKSSNILSFCVDYVRLFFIPLAKDLQTVTIAEIHTPTGDLIWRKRYHYSQKKAGRERELEELEANNCKLLKEEMDYAAEQTAEEFIRDIKTTCHQ